MTVQEQANRIKRELRKRTARTAGELAECAGFNSGREITLAIRKLVEDGAAVKNGTRRPTYTKAR